MCFQLYFEKTHIMRLFQTWISHRPISNPTMHQRNIPPCTILSQRCANMCTFLLQNGALWDTRLVHCGICVTGLLHIHKQWNAITHPWTNLKCGSAKLLLKLWHGWVISSTENCGYNYLSMPNTQLTHCGLETPYGNLDLGQHWCR